MSRPKSLTLTDGELRLMQVLWDRGEATVGDEESLAVGWFDVDALPDDLSERGRGRIAAALSAEPACAFVVSG